MVDHSKHVRVDNWGVFFLQRLQMFFNKTDYCDLTLQFDGNVQLKVHRLVMNACTEYFQVLEQTCDVVDDNIILMPPDLQADVILPIVNFMYTGTLEYHPAIYERLVRTADLMNIPILIKLLEAHKAAPHNNNPQKPQKQSKRTPITQPSSRKSVSNPLPSTLPGRKLPVWKRKTAPVARSTIVPRDRAVTVPSVDNMGSGGTSGVGALVSAYKSHAEPVQMDNAPKPTRFEWPEGEDGRMKTETYMDSSAFENLISYSSTPLIKGEDAERIPIYEEIRFPTTYAPSPPVPKKRPTSQQPSPYTSRRPNQTHQQYTFEEHVDSLDDEDQDPDDPDYHPDAILPTLQRGGAKRAAYTTIVPKGAKRVRFNEKENSSSEETGKPGTSKSGEREGEGPLDHSVLVAELLKKYPNLAKTNKNIKLKIMTKSDKPAGPGGSKSVSGQGRASQVKVVVQGLTKGPQSYKTPKGKLTGNVYKKQQKNSTTKKSENDGPWLCDKCENPPDPYHLYYLYRKHMTDVHQEQFSPLMCKYCGKRNKSDRALSFHMHTVHGAALGNIIGTPFPQCDRCSFSALTERRLAKHKLTHKSGHVQCPQCKVGFTGLHALSTHQQITSHISPECASSSAAAGMTSYDCQYCTRHWQNSATLFVHLRTAHREDARKDGIVSIDEDPEEELDEENETGDMETQQLIMEQDDLAAGTSLVDKVKILTDVKVRGSDNDNTVQMQMTNAGIATTLGLVDIVVLDENQQYILQSSNGDLEQSEFILPQITGSFVHQGQQVITTSAGQVHQVITTTAPQNSHQQNHQRGISNIHHKQTASPTDQSVGGTTTDELVMVLTDHDYNDETNDSNGQSTVEQHVQNNGNIVVLYSHPVQGGGEAEGHGHGESGGSLLVQTAGGQVLEIRNGPPELVDHSSQQDSIQLIQHEMNNDQQAQHIILQQEENSVENEEQQHQELQEDQQQQELENHEEPQQQILEEHNQNHEESTEDDFQDGEEAKMAATELNETETQEDDEFHEEADEPEEQQVMLVVAEDEESAEDASQEDQVINEDATQEDEVINSKELVPDQSIDENDGQIVQDDDIVKNQDGGQDVCGPQDGVDAIVEPEPQPEPMEIEEEPEVEENVTATETALPQSPQHQKSPELPTIQEENTLEVKDTFPEQFEEEETNKLEEKQTQELSVSVTEPENLENLQDGAYSPEPMEVDSGQALLAVENKDCDDLDDSIAEHGRCIDEQLNRDDKGGNVANSTFDEDDNEENDVIQGVPHITGDDEEQLQTNPNPGNNSIVEDSSKEETSKNDIDTAEDQEAANNLNGNVISTKNLETSQNSEFDEVEQNLALLHATEESSPINPTSIIDTQSTKNTTIALLDEWEDTEDSSSQDKNCQTAVKSTTPTTTTTNAVNKLINDDWDDDE